MAIVGYKLRVNGGAYTDFEIDVGLVYSYLLTGLEGSTEYEVEIASYDELSVQSAWSAPVSATTDAAPELYMVIDSEGNNVTNDAGDSATVLV